MQHEPETNLLIRIPLDPCHSRQRTQTRLVHLLPRMRHYLAKLPAEEQRAKELAKQIAAAEKQLSQAEHLTELEYVQERLRCLIPEETGAARMHMTFILSVLASWPAERIEFIWKERRIWNEN